jgi:hypothetical protein
MISGTYYFTPGQLRLRETLGKSGVETASILRRGGVPAPVVAGVGAAALFLAYTPLLQPGPPARRGDPYTLQPIGLGGGLIV